tara:strand:+ start:1909 stop:3531 length:1623 start_codon:yes stop_codon:yes gene_type:complete
MDLKTNPTIDQKAREFEIDSNPELQRTEGNPTSANEMMWHPKVYKTLATVGDFVCFVWYYDHDYDPLRTSTGSKRINIVPSEERLEDGQDINKYFNLYGSAYPEGAIYVNPIIRRNGSKFQNNKDLKDCVKYMSGVAGHYGADPSKIVATDTTDGNKIYDMSYDVSASSVFSDVSNDTLDALTSNLTTGSLSKDYETAFSSGSISMSSIHSNFGAGYALGNYYRGQGIANLSQNSHVPTSGTISFNNLRGCVSKITANANGNWTHAQARWELFSQTEWDSGVTKVINMNYNSGSNSTGDPAIRLNNSGGGDITLNINNAGGGGGGASGPSVRGHAGSRGSANSGNGGSGGLALHVASPVKIPSGHFNSRIAAGGGGGGGGGQGGQGGGGGNNGGYKCSGWFCHTQYRWCHHGSGGTGGSGGGGGQGGRGNGYYWDGGSGWWVDSHGAGQGSGSGGSGGSNGNSRAGGKGGTGGTGGSGGGHGGGGNTGSTGNTGSNGGGDQAGCGGYPGGQAGKAGTGGGSGGSAGTKYTTSHSGSINLT